MRKNIDVSICLPIKYKSGKVWKISSKIANDFSVAIYEVCEKYDCNYVIKCQSSSNIVALENEVRCQRRAASHFFAPKVLDSWKTDKGFAFIMEAMKETLSTRLLRVQSVEEAVNIIENILDLIVKLHSVGITHNDLHIQNIMFDKYDQVKFIDFGRSNCSKELDPDDIKNDYKYFGDTLSKFLLEYTSDNKNLSKLYEYSPSYGFGGLIEKRMKDELGIKYSKYAYCDWSKMDSATYKKAMESMYGEENED